MTRRPTLPGFWRNPKTKVARFEFIAPGTGGTVRRRGSLISARMNGKTSAMETTLVNHHLVPFFDDRQNRTP